MVLTSAAVLSAASSSLAPSAAADPGRLWYPAPAVGAWPGTVVGLGDSVPAGSACGCTTYVTLVGQALADGDPAAARVRNLARGGATTWSVLSQLDTPEVRRAVAGASVVLVTVGANDLPESSLTDPRCRPQAALSCYRSALASQASRIDRILATVVSLTAPGGGKVLVTGYWNVFKDGAVGRARGADYVSGSDALTRAFNAQVAAAASRDGARYVDVYAPFKGDGRADSTSLLAGDGDHPDARGHQVIATALLAALQAPAG